MIIIITLMILIESWIKYNVVFLWLILLIVFLILLLHPLYNSIYLSEIYKYS
jgi:hypothetical protein